MRATQLFRTVPHEVGHFVDYRQRVIEPSSSEAEFTRNLDVFWARPPREREEFADRYGREFRSRQMLVALIPRARVTARHGESIALRGIGVTGEARFGAGRHHDGKRP
jgi:hypothetical protein